MNRILPKLYLGNYNDAQNIALLRRGQISHILCAAAELRPAYPNQFTYKMIFASDHPGFNISLHLDSAADFIKHGMDHGNGVLVHCHMGISRSTTCIIAYLIKYESMDLNSALTLCKKSRPIVNPNPGFMIQLRSYASKSRQGISAPKHHIRHSSVNSNFSDSKNVSNLVQNFRKSQHNFDHADKSLQEADVENRLGLKSRNYNLHNEVQVSSRPSSKTRPIKNAFDQDNNLKESKDDHGKISSGYKSPLIASGVKSDKFAGKLHKYGKMASSVDSFSKFKLKEW